MSTQLKKFLQIYELLRQDTSVSKKFPMLTSPRLYLVIFFQIYSRQPVIFKPLFTFLKCAVPFSYVYSHRQLVTIVVYAIVREY